MSVFYLDRNSVIVIIKILPPPKNGSFTYAKKKREILISWKDRKSNWYLLFYIYYVIQIFYLNGFVCFLKDIQDKNLIILVIVLRNKVLSLIWDQ